MDPNKILEGLQKQREKELLCDVQLQAEGKLQPFDMHVLIQKLYISMDLTKVICSFQFEFICIYDRDITFRFYVPTEQCCFLTKRGF